MQKAVARWTGSKVAFEVSGRSGHKVTVDEPPAFGENAGMRPTELLLGALGSCTGINSVLLLNKFKQPFKSLEVEVEGDQEDEWPHAFTEIRITFVIDWDGKHDKQLVETALDMACNKYCPVDATLTRGTRIKHKQKDA